jgi:hypothetical protein
MSVSPAVPSDKDAVDMILGLAGLSVNDDEYERILRMYPTWREQAAALRIPEVRYAEPASIYPAV